LDKYELKDKINNLSDKIYKDKQHLKDLKDKCNHEFYEVAMYHPIEDDPNVTELRKICLTCGTPTGYPSKEEEEKWKKDE
jgi:hypothetical protein